MAFIDKLSKIAKSVGDEAVNAAKKSGDLIEITKLNHSISSEEDNIKAVYIEIGKLVYQKSQSGANIDSDLVPSCNRIDEINANIAVLKQKILDVRNVKACTGCGAQLGNEVPFCPKCGTKQVMAETTVTEQVEEVKVCSACTAKVSLDSAFCTSCGAKM